MTDTLRKRFATKQEIIAETLRRVGNVGGTPGPTGPAGADGADGVDGVDGADGVGVPTGGMTAQVLAKASVTDFDTEWVDQTGGGSGNVEGGNASSIYGGTSPIDGGPA